VDLSSTLLLGLVAGATILLGLPVGRLRNPAPTLRLALNAAATGVLVFLLWDVLSQAWEPIDAALGSATDGGGDVGAAIGYGLLFAGGLTIGLLSLSYYQQWVARHSASADEVPTRLPSHTGWSAAQRLSVTIAVGIGLHNFAEGLAIGESSAAGDLALATLLVVGFALHNATEGFGIVAPLAGDDSGRPSWGFLALLGLIGGGPTFVGTAVGYSLTSPALSVAFLTLAAGSILYVVMTLLGVAARSRRTVLVSWALLAGLIAGFLTDAVVTAAGA
jgi:ZIP family zinc transporter